MEHLDYKLEGAKLQATEDFRLLCQRTKEVGYYYDEMNGSAIAIPLYRTVTDMMAQGVCDMLALPDLHYAIVQAGPNPFIIIWIQGE